MELPLSFAFAQGDEEGYDSSEYSTAINQAVTQLDAFKSYADTDSNIILIITSDRGQVKESGSGGAQRKNREVCVYLAYWQYLGTALDVAVGCTVQCTVSSCLNTGETEAALHSALVITTLGRTKNVARRLRGRSNASVKDWVVFPMTRCKTQTAPAPALIVVLRVIFLD